MTSKLRRVRLYALPALLLFVAACASGVARSPDTGTRMMFGPAQQTGQISISLTPEAQQIASTTVRFDKEILLRQIRQGLEQRKALAAAPDQAMPSVEIRVTSIRSRSAFNAVMWGFMAGDDHIKGDVIVRGPDGTEIERFGVSASYALGGFAGGQTEARMGWLYETFAKHVVDELTGVKPATPSNGSPTS